MLIASTSQLLDWHGALLDEGERGRREGMLRPAAVERFTLGVALLRLAAGARLGLAPERVPIDRTCPQCAVPHGRPVIPGSGLHVSVSHSGERVAVALTGAGPVGVDVERVRPLDTDRLARRVGTAPGGDLAAFYVTWTRKESVIKATGEGLAMALSDVAVSAPGEPPRLLAYGGSPLPAQMADLALGEGYAGAVTVLAAAPVAFETRDARALLAERPQP